MITHFPYKKNVNEIAALFCVNATNPDVCKAGIVERMLNAFTNNTFKHFLANMNVGRYYQNKFNFSTWKIIPNTDGKKKTIEIRIVDVVTGNSRNELWEYWNNDPNLNTADLNWMLNNRGWQLIDPEFPPSPQPPNVIETPKLCYSWNEPGYGISYVPGSVGQTGGSGGTNGGSGGQTGGQNGGSGGQIVTTPAQTPSSPVASGFDIKSLVENPMVLIGVGLVAVYLIMKK